MHLNVGSQERYKLLEKCLHFLGPHHIDARFYKTQYKLSQTQTESIIKAVSIITHYKAKINFYQSSLVQTPS